MENEIHPGSWIGDTVEEFKKLPTWGKVAAGGVVIAVAWFAYSQYKSSQNSSPSLSSPGSSAGSMFGSSGGNNESDNGGSSGGNNNNGGIPIPQPGTGSTSPPVPLPPVHNPVDTPPPKHPPVPKPTTYTVQHGDSLSAIAAKQHIRGGWQALYNQNKGVIGGNPNLIKPGQKLNLTGLI